MFVEDANTLEKNIDVLELMGYVCVFVYVTEKRQAEASRIREKYQDRIPV